MPPLILNTPNKVMIHHIIGVSDIGGGGGVVFIFGRGLLEPQLGPIESKLWTSNGALGLRKIRLLYPEF